jgi:hypothetical protein
MSTDAISEALTPIKKIMEKHGTRCSPEEFHDAVNITFHNFEAEVYDQAHSDMWKSLPREFHRLVTDCKAVSKVGDRLHLLDTSPEMLERVAKRANSWNVPFSIKQGLIGALPKGKKYSLIVTCSVLHHIPDLPGFLRSIRTLQSECGIYLHLQDPNGDYSTDPEDLLRAAGAKTQKWLPNSISRFTPKRILGRIYRELNGKQHDSYYDKTNRALLKSGIIKSFLSVAEIYSITDIYVIDGAGISIQKMKPCMQDYELISVKSYVFLGKLWSHLSPNFRDLKEDLAGKNILNGMHMGAAWQLR